MPTATLAIALALLSAVPAVLLRFGVLTARVELATLFFGIAIVGASFAISWGAEASEKDIPRALALTTVALLAVLPEYAVDIVFAYKAGQDPAFAPYAIANMTGSNRLLLGLGWPLISVLAWLTRRRSRLSLGREAVMPLFFLAVATIYSFVLPLKASVTLLDSVLLIALFGTYAVLAAREPTVEPDLVGPAATLGELPKTQRRLSILGLFGFAAFTIGLSAEPFAAGLVHTGQRLGIDEFLLVQWLAPLASEAPEFVVAALLSVRGKASAALGLLLSSKLNQWTLLVGSLPVAYVVGAVTQGASGSLLQHPLPLDSRQVAEVWLTAAQSLFGVAVLAGLTLEIGEALLLASLFLAQLMVGGLLRASMHNAVGADQELLIFTIAYLILSLIFCIQARKAIRSLIRRRGRHKRLDYPAMQEYD